MESFYSGMSVGFGFLLVCTVLGFVWILFQNYKRRTLSQNKSIDLIDFVNYQMEEERKDKRADIIWPVSFKINNRSINTETKELSRSGAFIKCAEPLYPGEHFNVTIEIPAHGPISLNSEVVWSNANIPEAKCVTRGMGVRFIHNRDEDLIILRSALEQYSDSTNRTTGIPVQQISFM